MQLSKKNILGSFIKLAKHLEGAKQERWAITALLIASLAPALIKAQTVDQGTIQTTDNQTEWTTGKIVTPWINHISAGQLLQASFNDIANTTQNGYWTADYSGNIEPLEPVTIGNITGTMFGLPDSTAGQNISIKYMLSDTANGRHGVGDKIEGQVNRYEIKALINYTNDAGQPASIEFKIPDHLYNVFMDADTTEPVNFEPASGYSLTSNPQKFDSILNNIQDVMVLPEFEGQKTYLEQMNETSPYTGAGAVTNSTLEDISEGGITNPFDPASITFLMEDHSQKDYGPQPLPAGTGPDPKGDGDLDSKVFQTDKGPVIVTYFMPEETVTHPGAEIINNYQITTQAGEIPKLVIDANGLEYTVNSTQVNDTTFDVALGVKTPEGQIGSYDISVEIEGTPVTTADATAAPNFNATNVPNPFTSTTTLRYNLQEADNVTIVLYDMQGKEVQMIYSGRQTKGTQNLVVDGSKMNEGIFFANITSQKGGSHSVKLVKK